MVPASLPLWPVTKAVGEADSPRDLQQHLPYLPGTLTQRWLSCPTLIYCTLCVELPPSAVYAQTGFSAALLTVGAGC